MSRRYRVFAGVILAVILVVAGAWVANRPPAIPADAASLSLDRTVVVDDHGQRCADRAALGTGWADVCWAVDRIPDGSDNTQDYDQLRVYGSFEGLRWLVTRADLVGRPDGGAYVIWPKYAITGACRQVNVHLMPTIGQEPFEEVCGRTVGDLDPVDWNQTMTWTCELCLFPDGATKPLSMYASVAVPAGTVPEWELFVGGGA